MKTNTAGVPCVFFDRDGIVNESPGPGYVERVQDFHLIGAFVEALKLVRAKGYKAVVITNQRCIARGIVSVQTLEQIHMHLAGQLKKHGLTLDALYVCPHNNNECTCRKPHPGMLLQAAAEQQIDLSSSWMIGDHETDVEAGRRAGCRTIRVSPEKDGTAADLQINTMEELPDLLQRCLQHQ